MNKRKKGYVFSRVTTEEAKILHKRDGYVGLSFGQKVVVGANDKPYKEFFEEIHDAEGNVLFRHITSLDEDMGKESIEYDYVQINRY